jgi:hypothetical protein
MDSAMLCSRLKYSPSYRYDITLNSMMYATVTSPMAHLIFDYKNLRRAQIRRSHADAWNTQAHLITTYKPNGTTSNIPEWKGFNFGPQDRDTRVPTADGNPLALLFDSSGEGEVRGRDSIIRRQVAHLCFFVLGRGGGGGKGEKGHP